MIESILLDNLSILNSTIQGISNCNGFAGRINSTAALLSFYLSASLSPFLFEVPFSLLQQFIAEVPVCWQGRICCWRLDLISVRAPLLCRSAVSANSISVLMSDLNARRLIALLLVSVKLKARATSLAAHWCVLDPQSNISLLTS